MNLSKEEIYKLALFIVIRNNGPLQKGKELNKTEEEITDMALNTMSLVLENINYEEAKKLYEDAESRC